MPFLPHSCLQSRRTLRHTFSGLLASLLAASFAGSVQADRVELDNGDRWSGRLVGMDQETAWFEINPGGSDQPQEVAVARERLQAMDVNDPVTARLLTGERVIGTLSRVTSEGVELDSPTLGRVTLPWERVAELQGGGTSAAASTAVAAARAILVTKLENGEQPVLRADPERLHTTPLAGLPERNLLDERELAAFRGAGRPSGAGASPEAAGPDPGAGADPASSGPGASANAAGPELEVAPKMKEEDIRKVFLRESAVLLHPGQWEADIAFNYTRQQKSTVTNFVKGGLVSTERRVFESQVSFRTSPVRDVEVFVGIPLRYGSQKIERLEPQLVEHTGSRWGFGDTTAGVKYHAFHEGMVTPDIIFSVTGIAPTGDDPYDFSPTAVTFGGGHWGAGAGVTAIKTFDPAVIFAGIDYTYRFPGDFLGGTVTPGSVINYYLGTGFALNDKLSFSGQLSGTVQAGSGSAPGGLDVRQREQMALRLALTYQASQKLYLEPSLSIGLNDNSPDSIVGISISNRF